MNRHDVVVGDLLAVYGTLLSGLGAQERLGVATDLELVGPCRLSGTLVELGWYPGLLAEPAGTVTGELYRVLAPRVVAELDRYEGYDPDDPHSEYVRRRVRTLAPGDEAWVYLLTRDPGAPRITSGDWRAHVGRPPDPAP